MVSKSFFGALARLISDLVSAQPYKIGDSAAEMIVSSLQIIAALEIEMAHSSPEIAKFSDVK